MTTETLTRCDRCGATIVPNEVNHYHHTRIEVTTSDRRYNKIPMDLCKRCTKSLEAWLQYEKAEGIVARAEDLGEYEGEK